MVALQIVKNQDKW